MGWIWMKWTLVVSVISLLGIGLIMFWDWLVYRRIPHVLWRRSQLPPNEVKILRELMRLRRIKEAQADGNHVPNSSNLRTDPQGDERAEAD